MLELHSLQREIAQAVLTGDVGAIAAEFVAGSGNATARLQIFHNNTVASLTECLRTVFPVTEELSDARFFAFAAHAFISKHPPREARLSEFGADFPKFLAGFEPCREFPIIAEMATLEWAIALTLNSAEDVPALISEVNKLGAGQLDVGLTLQPNLHFVVTRSPLVSIWVEHKRGAFTASGPLAKRTSRVAVLRHGDDVQMMELDEAQFAFWRALSRGRSLEQAAQLALARDPLFDLLRETLLLFKHQLITRIGTLTQGTET